ncbi:MAG: hypothetical protein IOC56_02095 [Methylobacterium sp.]|nr:hypothetical protein [Methylobacterium sp.]
MPLAQAGVGTGSRKENAKKKERSIFERSMPLAQAGVGTGSRKENAKKKEAFSSEACPSRRRGWEAVRVRKML